MRGRYPKYLKNAKTILDARTAKIEETIFGDIFYLVKEGASFSHIRKYVEEKFGKKFPSKQASSRFILKLINQYCPNCIKCGAPRRHMHRKVTLFCEDCYLRHRIQTEESIVNTRRKLGIGTHHCIELDSVESLHGDISNPVSWINKFGTTNLGSHRIKDFTKESRRIKKEYKLLELKHSDDS